MTSSPDPAPWSLPELVAGTPDYGSVAAADGSWALPDLGGGGLPPEAAPRPARGPADERAAGSPRADLDGLLSALRTALARLSAAERDSARTRERYLHGLALAIARKLVQREVEADPALVGGLVTRALALFAPASAVQVRLHPGDLEALRAELDRLAAAGREVTVQWVPDPSLARGDVVVESGLRIVDGRSDVALRALYEQLDGD